MDVSISHSQEGQILLFKTVAPFRELEPLTPGASRPRSTIALRWQIAQKPVEPVRFELTPNTLQGCRNPIFATVPNICITSGARSQS